MTPSLLSESVTPPSTETPWGETWDDLAVAVLADYDSPPVLRIAAWLYRHGEPAKLRSMIAEALAFREPSAAQSERP